MKIVFSRHAAQRIKLYKIDQEQLECSLNALDLEELSEYQERTFVVEGVRSKKGTPIKVVVIREGGEIVIETNFPLRKGKWQ
jgi:hypothetical protein